jgi:hypothetical protein
MNFILITIQIAIGVTLGISIVGFSLSLVDFIRAKRNKKK